LAERGAIVLRLKLSREVEARLAGLSSEIEALARQGKGCER
jgi:hypothetical protein